MEKGDIMGHEFMGEIVEIGPEVNQRASAIASSWRSRFLAASASSAKRNCIRSVRIPIPNAWMAEKLLGHSPAGIFGYSHLVGGFAGGQAEYVRVPFADVGTVKIENGFSDEQVLFLSDIFPTGYMAAENCNIQPGDTVAIWGCGPVGQFAIRSCFMLGAERVIAIDRFPERLRMAREGGAETIDYERTDVYDTLMQLTGGRGPDSCMDAVGLEAHMPGPLYYYDRLKQAMMSESDRPIALRQAIMACRNGGTVSVPGVYGGFIDKFPMGSVMNRSLTIKTGQTHVQHYLQPLLNRIAHGDIDPSFVVTHRMKLADAPDGFDMFNRKAEGCIKIVMTP